MLNHQRRGIKTGDVLAAQTDIKNIGHVDGLFPKSAGLNQIIMDEGNVVHQNIEASRFFFYLLKQRFDLGVIAVITNNRDTFAAGGGDLLGGLVNRAGKEELTFLCGAAGHIDCRTFLAEGDGNSLTRTAARAGHDSHAICIFRHLDVPP